jgi:hypothetical protein
MDNVGIFRAILFLKQIGIIYGQSLYFWSFDMFDKVFSRLGVLCPEKSGNPAARPGGGVINALRGLLSAR